MVGRDTKHPGHAWGLCSFRGCDSVWFARPCALLSNRLWGLSVEYVGATRGPGAGPPATPHSRSRVGCSPDTACRLCGQVQPLLGTLESSWCCNCTVSWWRHGMGSILYRWWSFEGKTKQEAAIFPLIRFIWEPKFQVMLNDVSVLASTNYLSHSHIIFSLQSKIYPLPKILINSWCPTQILFLSHCICPSETVGVCCQQFTPASFSRRSPLENRS